MESDYIAHLDGLTTIKGGWLNKNYIQLGYQIADAVVIMVYSFVGTCIILLVIDTIGKHLLPALQLRVSDEAEVLGIDDAEIGEFAVNLFGILLTLSGLTERSTIMSNSLVK